MTKFSFNQAVPFEATHVGEVIKDELSARNMKQSELSELTGIQKSNLNDVIKGKRALTPEMALLIGNALGISAEFLINIQTQYDLYVAKQSERVVLQTKMLEILRQDSCSAHNTKPPLVLLQSTNGGLGLSTKRRSYSPRQTPAGLASRLPLVADHGHQLTSM